MMEPEELELVRSSVRQLLHTCSPSKLPDALVDSGWGDLLDAEPAIAVGVLAEEQGRSLAVAPTLDLVLLHGALLPLDATTAFVLPPLRQGVTSPAVETASGVRVDGIVLAGHERATTFVIDTQGGLVAVPVSSLELRPVGGADSALGLCHANGDLSKADLNTIAPADVWPEALSAGRRALASELVGLSEQMLADTVAYVLQRQQFGRQIGSFQAVKHRLADVRVAVSGARSAIAAAWADADPMTAMAAKCLAGRAHRLTATHCHQVHGGIAFTVEHGFHRFIRRGHLLDGLLGAADHLVRELGDQIIQRGVPRTPQLAS
jgi:hypothetical protein